MASPDESRADDARGPSGTPTSPASHEAPVERQAPVERLPAPPGEAQNRREPGPGAVPPVRPRGAASFPGGPPPASTPAEPLASPPTASVAVETPPRFQVTTVETTATASFPGGPPPARPDGGEPASGDGRAAPSRRRAGSGRRRAATPFEVADASPPLLTATATTDRPAAPVPPATAEETAPSQDAGGAAEAATEPAPAAAEPTPAAAEPGPAAAEPGPPGPAPARAAAGSAPVPAPAESAAAESAAAGSVPAAAGSVPVPAGSAPAPAAASALPRAEPEGADAEPAEGDVDEDSGPLARPGGGRRRRRGRRPSQVRAEARSPEAREARSPEAREARADQPAGEQDEVTKAARATGPGAGELALAGAPDELDGAIAVTASPHRGSAPAGEDEEGQDEDESAEGSARTRARRRRRAAAKVRTRTEPPAGEAAAVADGGSGSGAPAAATAAATAAAEAAPAGRDGGRPRPGQRGTAAVADAAPSDAKPERPSRGRGRGRLGAVARERAEAPAASATPAPAASATPPPAASATPAPDAEPEARTMPARPAAGSSTRLDSRGRAGQGSRQADRGRRRRSSGLTEEQKRLLREDGPDKRMLVTEGAERTQIGVLEGRTLVEHYVTRKSGRSFVGNIYLGRVQNVLPGMEAAFVDIGKGRNAVLYAGEVNYNEEDLDGEAPRIEKVLKPGQSVLVQVTKDPIGAKGARLTAQVSLAGRYLVLQPEDNTFGISRRLPEEERSRLREILKEVRPKGLGLIVRTAAEGATADDLRADLARLQARWEAVERKAKKASAPAVIYSEPELVVRVIRDIFSPDFVELVVDEVGLYERVKDYLEEVAPDLLPKLRRHDGKLPLFEHHHVVEQIHKALERKVWLPSGGSIVIDRTEAMTVVDVNTGKFVGRTNSSLEETVVANNLEAADEIVRQLRLRDIGGIVIIDFIDMLFERNQQAVIDRLKAALARDKTKSQVMDISPLGLVQMTRKRVSGGLLESFSEPCPTCEGRGIVITHEL